MQSSFYGLVVVLACAPQLGLAADWVEFDGTADGTTSYIDTASIRVMGNKRTAWTKVLRTTPQPYSGGMLARWTSMIEVDCKDRKQKTLSEVGYQPDGSSLYQFGESTERTPVIPDSIGETRFNVICAYRPSKR